MEKEWEIINILPQNEKLNPLLIVAIVIMLILVVQNQAIIPPSHLYITIQYEIQEGRMMQISYREYILIYNQNKNIPIMPVIDINPEKNVYNLGMIRVGSV